MNKVMVSTFCVFLILLLIPAVSISENTTLSKLGMTIEEFILKYNSVPATLESPYKSLGEPAFWADFNDYHVASFYPENDSAVALLLMSKDKVNNKSTTAQLDAIEVLSLSKEKWIPLVNVTKRCASIFSEELFGVSTASFAIIETINYYYENNLEKKGYTSYRPLNADETIAISFGYSDGYYFAITAADDIF